MVDPTNGANNPQMNEKKALGRAIAHFRSAKGLTQAELSEQTGRQGSISKIETGSAGVSTEMLCRLAKSLGVPVSAIWQQAEIELGVSPSTSLPAAAQERPIAADDVWHIKLGIGVIARVLAESIPGAAATLSTRLQEVAPNSANAFHRSLVAAVAQQSAAGTQPPTRQQ